MTITIPDEMTGRLTEADVRRELALSLYARDLLTTGQACRLAGIDRLSFTKLLYERELPGHYDVQELREDVDTLKRLGRL